MSIPDENTARTMKPGGKNGRWDQATTNEVGPDRAWMERGELGTIPADRPDFLEADTQVSSPPACTDSTAVTGPPPAMKPAPVRQPRQPRRRRRRLRTVGDEETTNIRPTPLAWSRTSGDKVNRLKELLRQHRGDFEVARKGSVPATPKQEQEPRRPERSGPVLAPGHAPRPRRVKGTRPLTSRSRPMPARRPEDVTRETREDLSPVIPRSQGPRVAEQPQKQPETPRPPRRRPPPPPPRREPREEELRPWLRKLEPSAPAEPAPAPAPRPAPAPAPEPEPQQVPPTSPPQLMLVPTPLPVADAPEQLEITQPRPRPALTPVPTPVDDDSVPSAHASPQLAALPIDQREFTDTAPQLTAIAAAEASEPGLAPEHLESPAPMHLEPTAPDFDPAMEPTAPEPDPAMEPTVTDLSQPEVATATAPLPTALAPQAPVHYVPAPVVEPVAPQMPAPAPVAPQMPAPQMPAPAAPPPAPVVAPQPPAHPLNFAACPVDEEHTDLPWSQRAPGEARALRDPQPTMRVQPLEWTDSDLYLAPPPSRRRRQAALATVLGLIGTLAVVAAAYFLMPTLPTEGIIDVRSVPAGATVRLDGDVVGTTPTVLKVDDFKREYELALTLDGYATWRDEVQLSVDEPKVGLVATMSPKVKPKPEDLQ